MLAHNLQSFFAKSTYRRVEGEALQSMMWAKTLLKLKTVK